MLLRLRPYLLLALLCLAFFHDLVLHPGQTLYADHSDLIDLHVPAKRFLVRSVQETGELPLWCPHQLAGAPFVHDIQAGLFYPPHAILYLLPEDHIGEALSWLVVLHVLLAGWGMFAYGRSQGLTEPAALVAAAGFMFAGRWLLHLLAAGHYVVVGLAWLPLGLLTLERAIRQASFGWATLAGGIYAAMILGTQPQWTFYASLFIAAWSLGAVLERAGYWSERPGESRPTVRRALLRWGASGAWMVLVGLGLAAVQLLPTAEAAGQALRSGGLGTSGALDGGLRSLLFLVGPALSADPHNLEWEDRGGLTLLWLAAAVLAVVAGRGRVRFGGGVALLFALFAVGGSAALQGLPGFNLFRQPPRMFVILGFPVALLAGHATDVLFTEGKRLREAAPLARRVLVRLLVALAILVVGYVLRSWGEGRVLRGHVYWVSLALTVPTVFFLLTRGQALGRRAVWVWAGLLLVDSWALVAPLVQTRPETELYEPPACVAWLKTQTLGTGRVLDIGATDEEFPLGGGAPLARIHRLESLRGYNPLDYRRYKQFLHFAGGGTEPLTAMQGPLSFPVLGNFPIANKKLLDLLNTRWLLLPAAEPAPPGWGTPILVDPAPKTFNFLAGGTPVLPPYALYENPTALPRAFIVFGAAAVPAEVELPGRLATTDFRKKALLEGEVPSAAAASGATLRIASIRRYQPNRVEIDVGDGMAGWLVLTDLWYPGWQCRIDGLPVAIRRANYLFRAVAVPEGTHEVAFTFEPDSYRRGRAISLATLAGLPVLLGLSTLRLLRWRAVNGAGRPVSAPRQLGV
jgi:hypothetical protein